MKQQERPSQRQWSWHRLATLASPSSWTRWWRAKQLKRAERRLRPLAIPLAAALSRLEAQHLETRLLVMELVERPTPSPGMSPLQAEMHHKEVTSLLLELLQETQPDPETELGRLIGLSPPKTSPPSSGS